MEGRTAYEEYPYPVVFLPPYENPPAWIPLHERIYNSDYNNELTHFLPRSILLKKPPGAQLGFNIRGGKASQLGIFISKVIPDSDAHRAGLQEGDQVLTVNNVDFQDIEHSKLIRQVRNAVEEDDWHWRDSSLPVQLISTQVDGAKLNLSSTSLPLLCQSSSKGSLLAVEILKTAREIYMQVRYFPYNYQRQKERTVH